MPLGPRKIVRFGAWTQQHPIIVNTNKYWILWLVKVRPWKLGCAYTDAAAHTLTHFSGCEYTARSSTRGECVQKKCNNYKHTDYLDTILQLPHPKMLHYSFALLFLPRIAYPVSICKNICHGSDFRSAAHTLHGRLRIHFHDRLRIHFQLWASLAM